MPTTEGKGLVAPNPVTVRLVERDHDNIRRCTRERTRYEHRRDAWGRGSVSPEGFDGGESPSARTVYIGFGGEWGYRRWRINVDGTTLAVDETPRAGGDRGVDFHDQGLRVQIKTARSDYDSLLIKQPSEDVPPQLGWDVLVRAQYPSRRAFRAGGAELFPVGSRLDFGAVDLLGWVYRRDFLEEGERNVPSLAGDWLNMELESCHYRPMSDLAALLRARKLREAV
jgi:hypothetical protein